MVPFGATKPHFAMWGLDHSGTLSIITENTQTRDQKERTITSTAVPEARCDGLKKTKKIELTRGKNKQNERLAFAGHGILHRAVFCLVWLWHGLCPFRGAFHPVPFHSINRAWRSPAAEPHLRRPRPLFGYPMP